MGFAAETEDLEASGRKKLAAKRLDLIVVNQVGREGTGFGADTNEAMILAADGDDERCDRGRRGSSRTRCSTASRRRSATRRRASEVTARLRAIMSGSYLFSSESVTEGHPDKLADRISDAILDAMLAEDPRSRVACETLVTTGLVIVSGEITCDGWVDIPSVVRSTVTDVGYTDARFGLDGETCGVMTAIQEQSPDIARGVEDALEHREGALGRRASTSSAPATRG